MNIPDSYWSAKPPTKPGWYAFKYKGSRNVFLEDVSQEQIADHCWSETRLWCRLVPAQELEKAFVEAQSIDYKSCAVANYAGPTRFEKSRARKVMEGEV